MIRFIKILIIIALLFFDYSEITSVNNSIKLNNKTAHPVHLSFTNLEYVSAEKRFLILFKIFADDFDKIILKKYNYVLDFEKKKKNKNYEKFVSKYINENFKLFINNKSNTIVKYDYHNFKEDEPTAYLYFTYKYKGDAKTFKIKNSLMTDLYFDQNNLLIFNYKGMQKAIKFDNKKIVETIKLN